MSSLQSAVAASVSSAADGLAGSARGIARRATSGSAGMGLGLLALALLGAGCTRDERPNLVLITLDTTRADRLGAYGDEQALTPTLDALAARGALFERAFVATPVTLPSHTSILTGLGPDRHGVLDNARFVARDALQTVPETLRAAGYRTGAFVSAFVLNSAFGLEQGFDVYDDDILVDDDPLTSTVPRRTATDVTNRAIAWLGESEGPLFLWTHYYDVHEPQQPPPPFDANEDSYAGALAYVDREVARLLAKVERSAGARPTFIVVVGDHGESRGEHGEPTHGLLAYDATLRVPLIVAGPGIEAGIRSERFVRGADVAPTLLAAAGQNASTLDGGIDGIALQQTLAGNSPPDRSAFFQTVLPFYSFGWSRIEGVRTERWKYTAQPQPSELYDLLADPGETTNRVAEEPAVVAELEEKFRAYTAAAKRGDQPAALSAETTEKLAMLGYVNAPPLEDGIAPPDPRRFVGVPRLIQQAKGLARDGHVSRSIEALQILSETPVARPMALRTLGTVYLNAGRSKEAALIFQQLYTQSPTTELQAQLIGALLQEGRTDEALAIAEATPPTLEADDDRQQLLRAGVLLAAGRAEEARQVAEELLARDPDDDRVYALAVQARLETGSSAAAEIERLQARLVAMKDRASVTRTISLLANLLVDEGRAAEAVTMLEAQEVLPVDHLRVLAGIAREHGNLEKAATLYESLLERLPADFESRRALAYLAGDLRRFDQALELYDALMAADPSDATLWLERGVTLLQMGHPREATEDFRHAILLDPKLPEPRYNLALIELGAGNDSAAKLNFEKAVQLNPGYARAHLELAQLYRKEGRKALADRHAVLAVEGGSGSQGIVPPVSSNSTRSSPSSN